jgi:hypothetical protein
VHARPIADAVGHTEDHDDEGGEQQERRGVVGEPAAEAHDAVGRAAGAHRQRQAQHEQGVREERAQDRGLRDHDLAGREREQHHEQLGQVPSVDWSSPVTAGPNRSPIASVENGTIQARPASATAPRMNTARSGPPARCSTAVRTAEATTVARNAMRGAPRAERVVASGTSRAYASRSDLSRRRSSRFARRIAVATIRRSAPG